MTAPDRLGKYEITEVLGRGAMGVVYKGFDPGIRRIVAIKTIRRELIEGERPAAAMLARFRNEAQAAGKLAHPGIVAVYDYGEDASVAYIAMEYVEGNSLREYLGRGTRFAERDAVSVMSQLLEALEHAHERRVWHRDIKPANIIVMMNGRVKVADFGIARIEASELTQTGAMLGSPGYMAPEQYAAAAIDHRADLFAAGVVFYQLVTGAKPFVGTSEQITYATCHTDGRGVPRRDPRCARRAGGPRGIGGDHHRRGPAARGRGRFEQRPLASAEPRSQTPLRRAGRGQARAALGVGDRLGRRGGRRGICGLAGRMARAEAAAAAEAKRQLELERAAEAKSARARAETQTKRRAQTEAPRRKESAQLAAASKNREPSPKPAAPAQEKAPPAQTLPRWLWSSQAPAGTAREKAPTAAASRYDGAWTATRSCDAFEEFPAQMQNWAFTVKGGEFVVERGAAGQPGHNLGRGRPGDDGGLVLSGTGINSAQRLRGKPYPVFFEGRFDGDRFVMKGRLGERACTLVLARG